MAGVSKGAAGEVLAARFLRDKGYTILASNYRCRQGEIDIIATDRRYIVFVEVKTRRSDSLFAPREAVTQAKQRRLLQTAAIYLAHHETTLQPRFDVVEVVTAGDASMKIEEINHILGAYEAGDLGAAF
ncbi:MAG: YraN family protein [Clostridia bacterium]|nr:YraN family protein [Clostridia bacterium]